MTDVTTGQSQEPAELSAADEQVLRELTERARAGGLKLTGEGGLPGKLTKMVVEGALEGELDDHLGYGKHYPACRDGGNSRNGHRAKTVLTEAGPVEITVPRDRDSSFEPKIVAKRQRRLTGIDEMVISLSAKGLTHGGSPRTSPRSTARTSRSRPSPRSPTGSWKEWPNGKAARSTRCTPSCSSTPLT